MNEKILKAVNIMCETMFEESECILCLNRREDTYTVLKTNEIFDKLLSGVKTVKDLYKIMYYKHRENSNHANTYEQFIDLSVFEKKEYKANIKFNLDNEELQYFLNQTVISDEETILFFRNKDEFTQSNEIEKEKVDTIQESYLFSMIVDLSKDICINPNTTEVSSDRQDFMNIKYSDWRIMISNTFKEQDKVLFLRASSKENIINTLEDKNQFHLDLQMMNMQGQYIWVRLRFARMSNFSRENPRFLYTVMDISADMQQLLKQEGITKAVEEQNEILQRTDKEKSKFFANMSHEIRTPINAIMGMNEVILRDCEDENIKSYAEDIKNASKYLLQLVNDILDFSKIEAGKMEIVPVEYSTADMLKSVCNMIKPKVDLKSLELETKFSPTLPAKLFADELRISQVLINLLNNAVKYTEKGKVTFEVNYVKDDKGNDAIEYIIEDTGIGIKNEDMEKLFSDYGRLDIEKNRRIEGTGLGMGIVNGLLSAMGSKLNVLSEYGKGSRFSFVLTQKVVDASAVVFDKGAYVKEEADTIDLAGANILVVDDTPTNLRVTAALLKPYNCNVKMANSGAKAISVLDRFNFSLILVDHMMPDMDGIETLHKIREFSDYYKNIPVIVLTGIYSPTAREEYISMGFTDYLEKPVSSDKLEQILRKYT